MFPRQKITEKFSTFIQFDHDRFDRWLEDPRLKRSMKCHQARLEQEQGDPATEIFWTIYWHQRWQNHPTGIAQGHLYAHLQEPCYWSAQKLSKQFSTTRFSLSDCFQAALSRLDKVLRNFKPELGVTLSTYASSAFSNAIRDALTQHREVEICSDWSLLRRVTRKRLREALQAAGHHTHPITPEEITWLNFKAICFPQSYRLRHIYQLTQADWQAIAQAYNHQRKQHPHLPEGNPAQIQIWLQTCAQHLRRYGSPIALSLNAYMEESEEFLEQVADDEHPLLDLMAQEEAQVRQRRQQEMARVLHEALQTLDAPTQDILALYYREQLKQKEIAEKFDTKQYTISRQISKARQTLLTALVQWSRSELHISLDPAVLNTISAFLEDWLQLQFSGDRTQYVAAR